MHAVGQQLAIRRWMETLNGVWFAYCFGNLLRVDQQFFFAVHTIAPNQLCLRLPLTAFQIKPTIALGSGDGRDDRTANRFFFFKCTQNSRTPRNAFQDAVGGIGLLGDFFFQAAEQADNGAYGQTRMMSYVLGPSASLIPAAMDVAGGVSEAAFGGTSPGKTRQALRTVAGRVPILGGVGDFRETAADLGGDPTGTKTNTGTGTGSSLFFYFLFNYKKIYI